MNYLQESESMSADEKLSRKDSDRPRRNQFLSSLYAALENKEYDNAISWGPDGQTIVLKKPAVIADKVLTANFFGMKFSSFIRQLNYYGFKRVSRRAKVKIYFHEQFQRGKKDFLKQIKRNHKDIATAAESSEKKEVQTPTPQDKNRELIESMQQKLDSLQEELTKMHDENSSLRVCVKNLSQQQAQAKMAREQALRPMPQQFNPYQRLPAQPRNYQTFFRPQMPQMPQIGDEFALQDQFRAQQPIRRPSDEFMTLYQPNPRIAPVNYIEQNELYNNRETFQPMFHPTNVAWNPNETVNNPADAYEQNNIIEDPNAGLDKFLGDEY